MKNIHVKLDFKMVYIFWILHAHFTVDYLRIIMLHLMILMIFLPIRNFQCTYFIWCPLNQNIYKTIHLTK